MRHRAIRPTTRSSRSSVVVVPGILALLVMLGACNTVSGVGKDVEAAGDAISDTAEDARN